jgi:sec-independent protein translocase protein TatA
MIGIGMPGMTEWIVILVIVLIFFGAGRLPEVFAQAGKGIKAFKDASEGKEPETKRRKDADDDEEEEEEPPRRRRKQLAKDPDPDELDDEEEPVSRKSKTRTRD